MATPVIKTDTVIGVEVESTEGTYVAPQANTSYIQPLTDGYEVTPTKELLERNILTTTIGKATPRTGLKGVTAALPVEYRASGTEGGKPDFDALLEGLLGNSRNVASQFTTGTSHTTTVLNGTNIHTTYSIGDFIVILDSGDHTVHVVTDNTTTDEITYSPARSSAPADNVVVSKTQTYYPADTGHNSLSLSFYQGNQMRQAAIGCKAISWSLDNYTTGQLATQTFGFEGLEMTVADGAAPHTPSFDSALPPVLLNACIYYNGTQIPLNTFGLNISQEIGFQTSLCSSVGKISSRITRRTITGTINPYMDDTTTTYFDAFDDNTTFSLIVTAYTPSSTSGEITLGTVCGIYLPSCLPTGFKTADLEGLLVDEISFEAGAGSTGSSDDIYYGMI
jgi:hypothetical protein